MPFLGQLKSASVPDWIEATPLVRLNHLPTALGIKAKLYTNLEYYNAGGSVKDRIAKRIVEKNGKRRGDQTWRYVDRGFQWQQVGLKLAVGEVEHGANIISQCRGIAVDAS